MENGPTQAERKKTWLTEGILIASVPVYVYILLLSFVIGYCDFFSIPVSFVSLNFPTMLWISYRLEFGLFFILTFTALVWWPLKSRDHPIANSIIPLLPYAGLVLLQIVMRFPWRDLWFSLAVLATLILSAFIFHRSGPSSIPRMSPYALNIVRRTALVVPWLIISDSVAMDMGRYVAARQRDYLVPASAPTTVVLSYFGETLVVAPFNRSTKEVEQSFWVVKIGEDPKLLLHWESVGPLHPKPVGGPSPTPASAPTPAQPPKPSSPEKHAP
jgi:hypothetical protein